MVIKLSLVAPDEPHSTLHDSKAPKYRRDVDVLGQVNPLSHDCRDYSIGI